MKLFYATKNKFKIQTMRNRISDLDIELYTPYDFNFNIDINEDGDSVIENAKIKALAYSDKVNMPVLGADSSLFVDKFDAQPGLFVKRVNGLNLNDDEIEDYYIKELNQVGGSSLAHYVTGIFLVVDGKCISTEIVEDDFLFTSNKYDGEKNNDVLGRIELDLKFNKYFCELTDLEMKSRGYVFDNEVRKFLIDNLSNVKKN